MRQPTPAMVCKQFATTALLTFVSPAGADQDGVSFWLPGTYGSLAVTPGTPGRTLGTLHLRSSVTGEGSIAGG